MVNKLFEGKIRIRPLVVTCVGAFLFCLPALWNRAPFVFPDTRAYYLGGRAALAKIAAVAQHAVTRGAGTSVGADSVNEMLRQAKGVRSAFYSLFVYGVSNLGSLWLVIAIQAVLLAWVCRIAFGHFGANPAPKRQFELLLFLALLTPAPWSASMIMPDLFASVLILTLVTLLVYWPELTTSARVLLPCAVLASILMHASYLPLAAVIGLVALLADWRRAWRGPARWLAAATAGGGAVVAMLLVALVGFHQLTLFPQSPPILLARSIEDGPARLYLKEHCPQAALEMCNYTDRLNLSADEFLWDPKGVYSVVSAGKRDRIRDEEKRIVIAAALEHPWLEATSLGRQIFRQLTIFTLQDYVLGSHANITPSNMVSTIPDQQPAWLSIRTVIAYTVVVLSIGFLLLIWRTGLLNLAQRRFSLLVVVGIVVNAVVCGGISTPQGRYEFARDLAPAVPGGRRHSRAVAGRRSHVWPGPGAATRRRHARSFIRVGFVNA